MQPRFQPSAMPCRTSRWVASLALLAFLAGCSPLRHAETVAWDWNGIIGTGQSLSVGAEGHPLRSTNQPYGNLKLSTAHLPWPIDPVDPHLALVPLIEPVGRIAPAYPSSWPENIDGETPHSAMGNQISALVNTELGRSFISIHSAVGESGQGMVFLRKNAIPVGVNGHSYQAALIETAAIARIARANRKSYGVGAITVTHGESDAGNVHYAADLYQLWNDFNADLRRITRQSENILMIVSQQNSCNDRSLSTLAPWQLGVAHPEAIVCSGPKYQYPYAPDAVHLSAAGYQQLGEKYGQIYYERVLRGRGWRPLEPTHVSRMGKTITITFHVPKPPLVWETTFQTPHASVPEWKAGEGFEVITAESAKVTITAAEISGDQIILTCASDPGPGARISYAMIAEADKAKMTAPFSGTFRWGRLRDSDPFRGLGSGVVQPNFAVAFEWVVP